MYLKYNSFSFYVLILRPILGYYACDILRLFTFYCFYFFPEMLRKIYSHFLRLRSRFLFACETKVVQRKLNIGARNSMIVDEPVLLGKDLKHQFQGNYVT